jgi:hypothetical protein
LAYANKGEYELSLGDFDIVMRFNPRNALALYARGLTLLKKGDSEAGKNDISAAKAINPNNSLIILYHRRDNSSQRTHR